jgi:hypothetical protein
MRDEKHVHTLVMPGLVPGIHALRRRGLHGDGRDKPGHDDAETFRSMMP